MAEGVSDEEARYAALAGVAALITVVAAAASLVPAFRATRVDPIVALRDE